MAEFTATDDVMTEPELLAFLCWDEDDDPEAALRPGTFQTCAGEWRREGDGSWRFWKDPEFEI